jgi:hypothetical protein
MLVYDGILPKEVKRACIEAADQGYRYAIEVDRPPPSGWENSLADRKWYEHRDPSETYERTGKLYISVGRDVGPAYPVDDKGIYNGGMFVFLLDLRDYETALDKLETTVVSAKPFKTILGAFE